MAYLLDTNHCFLLIARDPRLVAAATERATEQLATSVIVAGELRYGAAFRGAASRTRRLSRISSDASTSF